jgi:hypothetical protein
VEITSEFLNEALVAYRKTQMSQDLESLNKMQQQLSVDIKAALPENVHSYLDITRKSNGGHNFWLKIPGCVPISLRFTRQISGLELTSATVIKEGSHKVWTTGNLLLAIGYARNLYLQENEILG